MIVLVTVWAPPDQIGEMMKRFAPLSKAQLAEIGIKKWQMFGTMGGKDGNKAYHLIYTEKEMAEDALREVIRGFVTMWKVPGLRMRVEVLYGFADLASFAAGWDNL
ncbi:MAG TPA: hypothetical protein VKK79_26115 [Candidatus Lokiarchaeia archaeon]|nr:hypothetical protein [Candidatus Lokiarchaeia archaeon]